MPFSLVASLLGCSMLFVGCRPRPKSSLRPADASPAGGLTFIARDEPPVLVVTAARAAFSGPLSEGSLVVAAPAAEGAPPQPVVPGPPADAVQEALQSLTAEGRSLAPSPATLPFYDLRLQIAPATGRIEAQVSLDYLNTTGMPLSELPLRLFANARGPLVHLSGVTAVGHRAALQASTDATIAIIALDPPLPAGAWLHLTYAIAAVVPPSEVAEGQGLAASLLSEPSRAPDYGLFARFPGGIALADWLPLVAARFEGAFDLGAVGPVGDTAFADVASFRAAVDLPREYRLAAPGITLGEEALPNQIQRTHLALAAGRDLALFASKRYRVADTSAGATRIRVLYEEGHGTEGQAVLTAARRALEGLSQKLGAYPWTQLTAVEVPLGGGAGGAEFTGLVAIAGMFFTKSAPVGLGFALTGPFLAELREFTVTHEVAHQWWAIQVGSHPRLEPDVDEPLAQATAALILTPPRGARDRRTLFDRQVAINYQAMRLLNGEDGPAARATSEFESTAVYAGLVYGKAPLFYESLATEVGDESFWLALRAYADAHRFGLARRGDLLDAFAQRELLPRKTLDALYERWFGEAHGDVDLAGRGDPSAAAGDLFGAAENDDSDEQMDPEALLKAARAALSAVAQGKGQPQAGEQPLIDPAQAKKLLKQLDQTMGGVDVE